MQREELKDLKPRALRSLIREGRWTGHTIGLAPDYVQGNLVILPQHLAFDFLVFCQRNPKPCPVLEVTEPGDPTIRYTAKDADLRTDLPMYRVFEDGVCVDEVSEITALWRDDLVGFLLGCSASFEYALIRANIRLRHIEEDRIPPVYVSGIPCNPAGPFSGPMVVSARPIRQDQIMQAVRITSRYTVTHGGPVHIGDPAAIGITDLDDVMFGEPLEVQEDETPVFWACGITPQAVALRSKPEFMITHLAGHMFVTDLLADEVAVG
jgi:uncharacterized protein YcsI (UPF0317 family)